MITLYYSPQTRATSVIGILKAMGKLDEITVKTVAVKRSDGSGNSDPANPHPEGKVPCLQTDTGFIRERGAVLLWLTDHFESDWGRGPTHANRGDYLSWLFYTNGILEAALMMKFLGQEDNPQVQAWCRGWDEVLASLQAALEKHDFLVDDAPSVVDLMAASVFQWIPTLQQPGNIAAWVERTIALIDLDFVNAYDAAAMKELGLA